MTTTTTTSMTTAMPTATMTSKMASPTSCGNSGMRWAYYTSLCTVAFGNAASKFTQEYFRDQTVYVNGSTSLAITAYGACATGGFLTWYGDYLPCEYATIEWTGYVRATIAGTYTWDTSLA